MNTPKKTYSQYQKDHLALFVMDNYKRVIWDVLSQGIISNYLKNTGKWDCIDWPGKMRNDLDEWTHGFMGLPSGTMTWRAKFCSKLNSRLTAGVVYLAPNPKTWIDSSVFQFLGKLHGNPEIREIAEILPDCQKDSILETGDVIPTKYVLSKGKKYADDCISLIAEHPMTLTEVYKAEQPKHRISRSMIWSCLHSKHNHVEKIEHR